MIEQRLIETDGAEICAEAIGDPGDPAVLLIGGAGWSMDWWDPELCELIAAGERLVLRYDFRDTGQSTTWPAGEPGYTFADMVADALAVLDGFEIERAHLVGLSMGGALAQQLASEHRERVASLTLIATGPSGEVEDELPQAEFPAGPAEPADWGDRDETVEFLVGAERACSGPDAFEEDRVRATAARVFDRSRDIAASMSNHFILEGGGSPDVVMSELGGISALVYGGSADPLFGPPYSRALANAIPGARLVELEGIGHQLPLRAMWDRFVPELLEHTAG